MEITVSDIGRVVNSQEHSVWERPQTVENLGAIDGLEEELRERFQGTLHPSQIQHFIDRLDRVKRWITEYHL